MRQKSVKESECCLITITPQVDGQEVSEFYDYKMTVVQNG